MKILISAANKTSDEVRVIKAFVANDTHFFHLRRYESTEDEVVQFLNSFSEIERKQMVLNHHHFLASEFGINRLHFSEKDRIEIGDEKLEKLHALGFILSTSVHSVEDFQSLNSVFEYAFISPVFDSISKENYKAVSFDLNGVRKDIKLIALGGITIGNYNEALNLGFDGVAFLGGVWKQENPLTYVNQLVSLVEGAEGNY
jgi:thiamine-phosphate pyrophosphorylase